MTCSVQIYLHFEAVALHVALLALTTDVLFVAPPARKPQQQTLGLENQNTSDNMMASIQITAAGASVQMELLFPSEAEAERKPRLIAE